MASARAKATAATYAAERSSGRQKRKGWIENFLKKARALLAIIVFIVLLIVIGILLVGFVPNLLPSTLTQF